jgi:phosphoserine phosphatase
VAAGGGGEFVRGVRALASLRRREALLERNRSEGFVNVLVTGSLDFAMAPVVEKLGFEHLLANRLEFAQGRATGRLLPPVLAGETKVEAMRDLCRRYNVEPMSCPRLFRRHLRFTNARSCR